MSLELEIDKLTTIENAYHQHDGEDQHIACIPYYNIVVSYQFYIGIKFRYMFGNNQEGHRENIVPERCWGSPI